MAVITGETQKEDANKVVLTVDGTPDTKDHTTYLVVCDHTILNTMGDCETLKRGQRIQGKEYPRNWIAMNVAQKFLVPMAEYEVMPTDERRKRGYPEKVK